MSSKGKAIVARNVLIARKAILRFRASHAIAWRMRCKILMRRIRRWAGATSITILAVAASAVTLLVPVFRQSADNFKSIDSTLSQIGATYGTILALVLTLSIVPVQRAAEVWSPSIMRLYRRDAATFWAFVFLGAFCVASFFLGPAHPHIETSALLACSLVALGASLDVLRWYHGHICRLLDPIQAVNMALSEGKRQIDAADLIVADLANRQLQLLEPQQRSVANKARIEANIYPRIPGFPLSITSWINDLAEIAIKAIARNEKLLARASVTAIARLVASYFSARRRNITVTPDVINLFATSSDTDSVANPAYDALNEVSRTAIAQDDEATAIRVIEAYASIGTQATTLGKSPFGQGTAPLSFAPIHYALLCVKQAQTKGLNEIVFQSAKILARISEEAPTGLTTVHHQIIDGLTEMSAYFYGKTDFALAEIVTGYQTTILWRALEREDDSFIELFGYVLEQLATLAPLAIANETRAGRLSTTHPLGKAYDRTDRGAIANLFAHAAEAPAQIDPEREWLNPYRNLIEIAESISDHLRTVAERNEFGDTFLLWEIDRTIEAIAQIVAGIIDDPVRQGHGDEVELINKLSGIISFYWVAFRHKRTISPRRATECCKTLATLGLQFFKRDHPEVLLTCVSNIKSILESLCEIEAAPSPYTLGDLFAYLWGIRMAVADRPELLRAVDEALLKPGGLDDEQWQVAQRAIQLRRRQLEEELEDDDQLRRPSAKFTQALREVLSENNEDTGDDEN